MTVLTVNTPVFFPLTRKALQYAWNQLAGRIKIKDKLEVLIYYGHEENLDLNLDKPLIWIKPCTKETFENILNLVENSLTFQNVAHFLPDAGSHLIDQDMPALFWSSGAEDGKKPFLVKSPNRIMFNVDILAATFFMLSRWEEVVLKTRDNHNRFPAHESTAYKQGFLDRPVIDEYSVILRECLKILRPRWAPEPSGFRLKISHDIDSMSMYSGLISLLLRTAGDIVKRFKPRMALKTLQDGMCGFQDFKYNPYIKNIKWLADVSLENRIISSFNFMMSKKSKYDPEYELSKTKEIINYLQALRFEIGFHPGYYTFNNDTLFLMEKERMDQVLGRTNYGGRQHYLRFEVPMTWRLWERASLIYDSTLGYPEQEGFRCGTCYPYQPFDVLEQRIINIYECPLIVMDSTLANYKHINTIEAEKIILDLAKRCACVGGVFTMLWHNTSLCVKNHPYREMYRKLLPLLQKF